MANPLLKQLLGEAGAEPEATEPWLQAAMEAVRKRFIEERVNGWTTVAGKHFPAISQAEAEARWQQVEPNFRRALLQADPATVARLKREYQAGSRKAGDRVDRALKVNTASPNKAKTCPHCGGAL